MDQGRGREEWIKSREGGSGSRERPGGVNQEQRRGEWIKRAWGEWIKGRQGGGGGERRGIILKKTPTIIQTPDLPPRKAIAGTHLPSSGQTDKTAALD